MCVFLAPGHSANVRSARGVQRRDSPGDVHKVVYVCVWVG